MNFKHRAEIKNNTRRTTCIYFKKEYFILFRNFIIAILLFLLFRWINLENGLQAILISDLLENEEEAEEAPWDDEDERENEEDEEESQKEADMETDDEEEEEEGGEKKVRIVEIILII